VKNCRTQDANIGVQLKISPDLIRKGGYIFILQLFKQNDVAKKVDLKFNPKLLDLDSKKYNEN
jgi:hypothetical protein